MLIVDDHPLTRDGLAALLAGHGFDIVGEASGGHEGAQDRAPVGDRPLPAPPGGAE